MKKLASGVAVALAIAVVASLVAIPVFARSDSAMGTVKVDLVNNRGDVGGEAIANTQANGMGSLLVKVDLPALGGQTVNVFVGGDASGQITLNGQGKDNLHLKEEVSPCAETITVEVCVFPVGLHPAVLNYCGTLTVPVK